MRQLLCSRLLGLGLLLVPFSPGYSLEDSFARRLCGRHLLEEIVKLCGNSNWGHYSLQDQTLATEMTSQASLKAFKKDRSHNRHASFLVWKRFTNPASVPRQEAASIWEGQSLPAYQHDKANLLTDKTREFSSSRDVKPYSERVKLQKKSTSKITSLNRLFWGNRLQRKRRGFSDKCCLKGCTREELAIACIPYLHP